MDNTLLIYDFTSSKSVLQYFTKTPVYCLCWDSDFHLFVGTLNGRILVYDIRINSVRFISSFFLFLLYFFYISFIFLL
jgi:WD40 repeat protein